MPRGVSLVRLCSRNLEMLKSVSGRWKLNGSSCREESKQDRISQPTCCWAGREADTSNSKRLQQNSRPTQWAPTVCQAPAATASGGPQPNPVREALSSSLC